MQKGGPDVQAPDLALQQPNRSRPGAVLRDPITAVCPKKERTDQLGLTLSAQHTCDGIERKYDKHRSLVTKSLNGTIRDNRERTNWCRVPEVYIETSAVTAATLRYQIGTRACW